MGWNCVGSKELWLAGLVVLLDQSIDKRKGITRKKHCLSRTGVEVLVNYTKGLSDCWRSLLENGGSIGSDFVVSRGFRSNQQVEDCVPPRVQVAMRAIVVGEGIWGARIIRIAKKSKINLDVANETEAEKPKKGAAFLLGVFGEILLPQNNALLSVISF